MTQGNYVLNVGKFPIICPPSPRRRASRLLQVRFKACCSVFSVMGMFGDLILQVKFSRFGFLGIIGLIIPS